MKKLLFVILLTCVCSQDAFCGINKALIDARRQLQAAETAAQYEAAKKKFESAKLDVGYVPEEHDKFINDGISACNAKINELSNLLLNGRNSLNLSFDENGGTQTITISRNQTNPNITSLPSWVTITNSTYSSITVKCDKSFDTVPRDGIITISSGSKSAKVNIHQDAGKEPQLEIYDIEFANMQSDGTIINDYGATLYSTDMRFLHPRIRYRGLESPKTETIKIKIINPQGELLAGGESVPAGFTQLCDVTFLWGPNNISYAIDGMGHHDFSSFSAGVWTYELWIKEDKVFSAYVEIKAKGATYLMIDNRTSLSTSFDADGGSKTYNISTDGSDWYAYDVPDFCQITNRGYNSLTLRCNTNTAPHERKGTMKIICGDKCVQIGVFQEAGKSIEINRVWADFNLEESGANGLMIHVDFSATDIEQHSLNVVAYFEYSTGTPLKDTDGNYRASDGRIAVEKTVTAQFDYSQWGDFKLFMPYSQIHTPSGNHSLRFYVQIYDKTTGVQETSGYTDFTFKNITK